MREIDIFQNPYYREISTMRGRTMRGLPVYLLLLQNNSILGRILSDFVFS